MTKSQRKELDNLWKVAVYTKYGKVCSWPGCGKTKYVQAHHFISRSNYALRWDVRNGVPLCRGHHNFTAHVYPETFRDWFIKTRTDDYTYISVRRHSQSKNDYNLIKLYLEEVLNVQGRSSQ